MTDNGQRTMANFSGGSNKAITANNRTGGSTFFRDSENANTGGGGTNLGKIFLCTECYRSDLVSQTFQMSYQCLRCVHSRCVELTVSRGNRSGFGNNDAQVSIVANEKLECYPTNDLSNSTQGSRNYSGITTYDALCDVRMLNISAQRRTIDNLEDSNTFSEKIVAKFFANSRNIFFNGLQVSKVVRLLDDGKLNSSRSYPIVAGSEEFAGLVHNQDKLANHSISNWERKKLLLDSNTTICKYIGDGSFGKVLMVNIDGVDYALKYGSPESPDVGMREDYCEFLAITEKFQLESEYCKANAAISLCGGSTQNIVPHYAFFFIYLGPLGVRGKPLILPALLMKLMGPTIENSIKNDLGKFSDKNAKLDIIYNMIASIGIPITNLHRSGFIHGDMKSDNIIGGYKQNIFDSSAKKQFSITDFSLSTLDRSRGKIMCDSFRAPEIWLGTEPTTAADIWGLGCIFIDIWSGQGYLPTEHYTIPSTMITLPSVRTDYGYLSRIVDVFGALPENLRAVANSQFKERNGFRVFDNNQKYPLSYILGIPETAGPREQAFLKLIMDMMKTDPKTRITMDDICRHPFMLIAPK